MCSGGKPDDKTAARLMVHLHSMVDVAAFRANCPHLARLASVYEKHTKSYVLMLTWADGLWMHADLRASECSSKPPDYDESQWKWAAESRAKGSGPKDNMAIVGHTIAGGTQTIAYANGARRETPQQMLGRGKWSAPDGSAKCTRGPGQMTLVPCWVHSGAASLTRTADGTLYAERVTWDPVTPETRAYHSATASGPSGFNVSFLAMVEVVALPPFLEDLAAGAHTAATEPTAPTKAADATPVAAIVTPAVVATPVAAPAAAAVVATPVEAPVQATAPAAAAAVAAAAPVEAVEATVAPAAAAAVAAPVAAAAAAVAAPVAATVATVAATPVVAAANAAATAYLPKSASEGNNLLFFRYKGPFQQQAHKQYPRGNNSGGRGGMDPEAWKAKCASDQLNAARRDGFSNWPDKCADKCADDQLHSAERDGFSNWPDKCADDKLRSAERDGYSNWPEKLASSKKRGAGRSTADKNETALRELNKAGNGGWFLHLIEMPPRKPGRPWLKTAKFGHPKITGPVLKERCPRQTHLMSLKAARIAAAKEGPHRTISAMFSNMTDEDDELE